MQGPQWESIAGWVAGILGFVSTLFVTAVYYWTQDRFRSVDDKIDKQAVDIRDNSLKTQDHDVKLGELSVHMQHTNHTLEEIRQDIKRLVSGQ